MIDRKVVSAFAVFLLLARADGLARGRANHDSDFSPTQSQALSLPAFPRHTVAMQLLAEFRKLHPQQTPSRTTFLNCIIPLLDLKKLIPPDFMEDTKLESSLKLLAKVLTEETAVDTYSNNVLLNRVYTLVPLSKVLQELAEKLPVWEAKRSGLPVSGLFPVKHLTHGNKLHGAFETIAQLCGAAGEEIATLIPATHFQGQLRKAVKELGWDLPEIKRAQAGQQKRVRQATVLKIVDQLLQEPLHLTVLANRCFSKKDDPLPALELLQGLGIVQMTQTGNPIYRLTSPIEGMPERDFVVALSEKKLSSMEQPLSDLDAVAAQQQLLQFIADLKKRPAGRSQTSAARRSA